MVGSGIITRGYGYNRSTIITRGYARIVNIIETVIEDVIPHRHIKGKSSSTRTYNKKIYDEQYEKQERYEEICVSVELVGIHGEYLIDSIKNKICQQLNNKRISVEVVDIDLIQNESITTIVVNTIRIVPIKHPLKIIAKIRK